MVRIRVRFKVRVTVTELRKKGRNVLFNEALKITLFICYKWSWTYSKGPVRKETRYHHYISIPTDKTAHTTVFVTPVMEHWLEQKITQWLGLEKYQEYSVFLPINKGVGGGGGGITGGNLSVVR